MNSSERKAPVNLDNFSVSNLDDKNIKQEFRNGDKNGKIGSAIKG